MEFKMISLLFIQTYFPLFLKGLFVSLQIAFFSCCIGATLGTVFGIVLAQKIKPFDWLVYGYVVIIRGTPMLIQIATIYFILQYAGCAPSAFWSAIVSIGLNSAAYVSQIVVAGIHSVGHGQIEAAKTLGFTKPQIMYYIILPQALRAVLPALGNELVTLIKDSSLASTIGVYELAQQGKIVMSQTYNAPAVYILMGAMYLIVTTLLSGFISWLEKRMQYYVKR